jgi:hypothetical protein
MKWDCAQLEERLQDYLEGGLDAPEQAAAEAHIRTCARCGEWAEARHATLWLRLAEPVETPPGLETRILALTVAPPPQESFWAVLELGWRALLRPRFALGLAAALFSLGLALNAMNVSAADVQVADLNPVNIYRAVNRQAQQGYARGVRFVNDLWLVYEIRSRLEEMAPPGEAPPASSPSDNPNPSTPKQEKKPENSSDRAHPQWLLACQGFGGLGELR